MSKSNISSISPSSTPGCSRNKCIKKRFFPSINDQFNGERPLPFEMEIPARKKQDTKDHDHRSYQYLQDIR